MKTIFIIGHHGVGKTHLMNNYINNNNIYTFDAGPFLRGKKEDENPEMSMKEWVEKLEEKYGYFATTELMAKEIKNNITEQNYKALLIFGFRHLDCIEHLIEILQIDDWRVVYLDADFQLIKQNYEKRENIKISDRTFERELEEENKWGLGELRQWVENNSTKAVKIYKKRNDNSFKNYIDQMIEM